MKTVIFGVSVLAFATMAAAATPDAWITTKAKMALLTTEGVSATAVDVDTIEGKVTLHGTVDTAVERAKAETAVRGIDGVTSVRNLLQVVPRAREGTVAAADDEIKTRVEKTLSANKQLGSVSVASVNAGVVLLSGSTPTLSDHLEAIERASRVPGVKRVASEIQSPDKLADAEIYSERHATGPVAAAEGTARDVWVTSAVKMRLLADERTPGLDINVDTTAGQVTLFGTVPSAASKAAAEEDTRKVSGVTAVRNDLQIVAERRKEEVEAKDDQVKDRVESALSTRDDLKDADIDVEVRNGVARLTGTVPSQEQRLRAAVVARTAPGVRAVQDDLRVAAN